MIKCSYNVKINFFAISMFCRPKMVPKLKILRIYWNLEDVIFPISRSRFWCQKLFSLDTYHLWAKFVPKLSVNFFLKFDTLDISNMLILILMLKMIFIKYLELVRPRLVPKSKIVGISWSFAHLIFWISRC